MLKQCLKIEGHRQAVSPHIMNLSARASQSILAATMSLQNFLPFLTRSTPAQTAHSLTGGFRRGQVVNDGCGVIVANDSMALALCLIVHLPRRMNPVVRHLRQLWHPLTDETTCRVLVM